MLAGNTTFEMPGMAPGLTKRKNVGNLRKKPFGALDQATQRGDDEEEVFDDESPGMGTAVGKPNVPVHHTPNDMAAWNWWDTLVYLGAEFFAVFLFAAAITFAAAEFGGTDLISSMFRAVVAGGCGAMVWFMFGPTSGAYLNPLHSLWIMLAFLVSNSGKTHVDGAPVRTIWELGKMLLFWIVQAGSWAVGTVFVAVLVPDGAAALWGRPEPYVPSLCIGFREGAGAFILVAAYFVVSMRGPIRSSRVFSAALVGSGYFVSNLLFQSSTGASFNPFRYLFPALYLNDYPSALAYLIGPAAGGIVVLLFFAILAMIAPAKDDDFENTEFEEEFDNEV